MPLLRLEASVTVDAIEIANRVFHGSAGGVKAGDLGLLFCSSFSIIAGFREIVLDILM